MTTVRGSISLKYIRQGGTIACSLRSTYPLKQFVAAGTGAVAPSFAQVQPALYPVIESSLTGAPLAPLRGSCRWFCDQVELDFDADGLSLQAGALEAGTFRSEWRQVEGLLLPVLVVCRDLARATDTAPHTIRFSGEVNTGFVTRVQASIEAAVEQTDGQGYTAWIALDNGGVIDERHPSLTARAHLLVGGEEPAGPMEYRWYRMALSEGREAWQPLEQSGPQLLIDGQQVHGSELYRCVIAWGERSAEALAEVSERWDVLLILPNPTDGAGGSVAEELSVAQPQIVYVPRVCRRSTLEPVARAYTFHYLLTDAAGHPIASQRGGASFTVRLAHGEQAGGDVTLILTAE